jgi:hypothetical protein
MTTTTAPTPTADRPRFPRAYGVPKTLSGLMDWGTVQERLNEAKVYWVGTAGPDGRPAVRPVDGLWLDGGLHVGGSPETLWVRNLLANPRVSVHLDGGHDVAILEGEAELLADGVEPELAERIAAESNRKYGYGVKADDFIGKPAGFRIRPRLALAWRQFPKDVTRFRFEG